MPLLLGALGIIAGLFLFEILKRALLFGVMCITAPPPSTLPPYDPIAAQRTRRRFFIVCLIWAVFGAVTYLAGGH